MVAIAQRDVRFALRSRAVSIPLIVLPLVLLLLLPLIVALNRRTIGGLRPAGGTTARRDQ